VSGLDGVQRWTPTFTGAVERGMTPDDGGNFILVADAERAIKETEIRSLVSVIFHSPDTGPKAFALVREHDVSGTVAYGVEFPDGCVALRWVGGNPTSVVFHDNGMESVEAIHGHGGHTKVMWLSEDLGERSDEMDECQRRGERDGISKAIAEAERIHDLYAGVPVVQKPLWNVIQDLRALLDGAS
jgi:hypothetical protein